ncbi:CDP-glucose 4,6-dehydratase [Paenibacillus sp. DXFW5]|uniref:CDP-glucose 4,6-dehydratase n=1 Tax=Paenibacillus rhizolycopersici TaxID=2780073 RepID=A0ABS2H738_9BACL|nr:CDP-glucose 4,6-dehydratase [Paenibacillus rhizolycopersici]MBM6997240.1 CDP-glucose 4,6-dehydratase [Paenibacillus rhizolycopersici]
MGNNEFWKGKKVFITGNTGFKGSWLSLWLLQMGAEVTGFSLEPPTKPSLYELLGLNRHMNTYIHDVRDLSMLTNAVTQVNPDVVFHMAAQPLVRESYTDPTGTYAVNVMGTVNLLESVRYLSTRGQYKKRAIINVTTDKCYENREWDWGYREIDALGGYDPYSNSKACSELVTASYRHSFFNPHSLESHGVLLASARAGNVIGGGDWAVDRLIPDSIKSLLNHEPIRVRNPLSIRPWQHVLEPLNGYMLIAQNMYESGGDFATSWNFGPNDVDTLSVESVVQRICTLWGGEASYSIQDNNLQVHESRFLKLDCSKAKSQLGWSPRFSLDEALMATVDWYKAYRNSENVENLCSNQIAQYTMEK